MRPDNKAVKPPLQGLTTPAKLYYKIGEVCEIVGVPAHVLRFWEQEFPQLAPSKSSKGHRLYKKRDIETVFKIKELLYEKMFTIRGAREFLAARSPHEERPAPSPPGEVLGKLKDGLQRIRLRLERTPPF